MGWMGFKDNMGWSDWKKLGNLTAYEQTNGQAKR
jgi:hypothetical protein